MIYTKQELTNYLEWDENTWSKALYAWDEILNKQNDKKDLKAIELGGRNGGLSLYLAQKGIKTVCSDFGGPTEKAKALHEKYNVAALVEYKDIDATKISYPDNTFDIVIFKSILGVVAANGKTQNLDMAAKEIYRILKPGGYLLFAENMKASVLHTFARRWFVRWGGNWHYLSQAEIKTFVSGFAENEVKYYGFSGAFIKIKQIKGMAYFIDSIFDRLLPNKLKYISYGWAKKFVS